MDNQFTEEELQVLTWMMRMTAENPWFGFLSYLVVVALTIVVFNLGFARELPILKKAVVYILLVIGSFVMWFLEFAFGAPIIAVLIISGVILGMYRFRLHKHRKEKDQA
ncbi:YlaH-like family protein [Alkalihalobacillus sp. MEB130]|uniref:YlaH-like family protein n=1 Tax=Alkalihalobacillus sp. MEB130 TaxID=2976704 RepID=UPI0028DEDD3D|nr:YlaH-like family protein [Alkalihalobacillus sp. MEB130]MDT8859173.1 YlaH-like family protein [Alkalihalobacillus sp. MEB130]